MIDERPPVIWEKGVKIFGEEDMMKMMVQNFEPQSFDLEMRELSSEFVKENWPEVKRHAHTLKGSSSYIGADRFSEVCFLLQNAANAADVPEIISSYEKVLKEGKILKNHLAKLLNKTPDTTEVDSYIAIFEKIKKSKKTSDKPKEQPKDRSEEKKSSRNANSKPHIEENKEEKAPLPEKAKISANQEKKSEQDVNSNSKNTQNANKPTKNSQNPPKENHEKMGVLESGEPSADKACCKQCVLF